MAGKRVEVYLGESSVRTCLGSRAETLAGMNVGCSGLRYSEQFGMFAGLCDVRQRDGFTRFEALLVEQLETLFSRISLKPSDATLRLIISTTKGNVDLLEHDSVAISPRAFLAASAEVVGEYFSFAHRPIVVSNACISGISAMVVAQELLRSGLCQHVVVAGCDVLSEFVTSGFASFKSVSASPCRPYDAQRDGLTLGEAAAALLLTTEKECASQPLIRLAGGAITNDANHISAPSRTGEGLYLALIAAMRDAGFCADGVGFVNPHGTATLYNDAMEGKALARAGLMEKPINGLKGYIGHTLGASGVVETILCAEQMRQGHIVGTVNFNSADAPELQMVTPSSQKIKRRSCVKTASGFGGCNAAVVLDMEGNRSQHFVEKRRVREVAVYELPQSSIPFAEYIRSAFKSLDERDLKFYKMSDMSKALYVSTARLLAIEGWEDVAPARRAIIIANRSASLDSDSIHQQNINQRNPEGPSPAAFVYTLANVAVGEMCIRHKIQGDNTFFIENEESGLAERYATRLIESSGADAAICGWCDYLQGNWSVNLKLLKGY